MANNTPPKSTHDALPSAYLDYNKSMVRQGQGSPLVAGLLRGAATGGVGAILAGIAANALDAGDKETALAALGGFVAGSVPGYLSGRGAMESNNGKLLAMRRFGFDTPAEVALAKEHPQMAAALLAENYKL